MNAWCYIIFSKEMNRYYIGSTKLLPEQRLLMHLSKEFGSKQFTAKANDWVLILTIECNSIQTARKVETYLKRMRNSKYYQWLSQNPEALDKLKEKFQ